MHTSVAGDHAISGYLTSRGTFVQPSHATNPDGTRANNYSAKGNVNPYTGQAGTKSHAPSAASSALRTGALSVGVPIARAGFGAGAALATTAPVSSESGLTNPAGIETPHYERALPPATPVPGKSSSQVERLARAQGTCPDQPTGALQEKGAGYEVYTGACRDGTSSLYRCEFGQCSASR